MFHTQSPPAVLAAGSCSALSDQIKGMIVLASYPVSVSLEGSVQNSLFTLQFERKLPGVCIFAP